MHELFSVIITTYECYGSGKKLLEENLSSLLKQTYQNIECIITDHSKDGIIQTYVDGITPPGNVKIVYTRYSENYGNPSYNWNNGLKFANGEFIHCLCMDERYSNSSAITDIVEFMKQTESKWIACSQIVEPTNYKYTPRWNSNILRNNTLSGNGAIVIKKELKHVEFDPQFIQYLDTDYYYRLFLEVGEPTIFDKVIYIGRIHENQLTFKVCNKERIDEENIRLKKKYNL
jgi:glycosyltransferase involved in cell wall biosynthesis